MQPISAITRSGRRSFSGLSDHRNPAARSSALWRTTQVLSTITSAWQMSGVCAPPSASNAAPTWRESALFIWQPTVQT
jgi:hypothetical protein